MPQVEAALEQGTDVVFRLDIQGAHTIRRKFPDALSIFLVRQNSSCVSTQALRATRHASINVQNTCAAYLYRVVSGLL